MHPLINTDVIIKRDFHTLKFINSWNIKQNTVITFKKYGT